MYVSFVVFVWDRMKKIVVRVSSPSGVSFSVRSVIGANARVPPGVVVLNSFEVAFSKGTKILPGVGDKSVDVRFCLLSAFLVTFTFPKHVKDRVSFVAIRARIIISNVSFSETVFSVDGTGNDGSYRVVLLGVAFL